MKKNNLLIFVLSIFLSLVGVATASAIDFYFGGQYRVNYLAANAGWGMGNSRFGGGSWADDVADWAHMAARFRPTFDVKFSDRVWTHLQAEIGHVVDSGFERRLNNGAGSDGAPGGTYGGSRGQWQTRHATINLQLTDSTFFSAGIHPYTTKFGEFLSSGDWDFNLLGLYFVQDVGFGKVQLGTMKISEDQTRDNLYTTIPGTAVATIRQGADTGDDTEDVDYYFFDFDTGNGPWTLGVSVYWMNDKYGTGNWASDTSSANQVWAGGRGSYAFGNGMALNGMFAVATGDSQGTSDNTGWFGNAQLVVPVFDACKLSVQGVYSSGDDANDTDPNNTFYTVSTTGEGYWSYTGIATPHGPSDTDDLVVNLWNNGQGLTTVQGKFDFPIITDVDGTVGIGWYQASNDNAFGDRYMGTDVLAQIKWVIERFDGGALALELGGSYMDTGDYFAATATGNPDNLYQVFSRFQVEW